MNASCTIRPPLAAGSPMTPRSAWTAFWQELGQSQCLSGAADIQRILTDHWASFAASLPPNTRILDLGCGNGAVARSLATARKDIHITGVDFARIPLVFHKQFELLSETEMEALPFADESLGAVVSQFGYEYSQTPKTADEMARVLMPNARFRLVVHHADSSVVAADRCTADALDALRGVRAVFCSGDKSALTALIRKLTTRYPHERLVAELARALPSRIERSRRERRAIWKAIEDALAPERAISRALQSACVAPRDMESWLAPLRHASRSLSVSILYEANGRPLAWIVDGCVGHEG